MAYCQRHPAEDLPDIPTLGFADVTPPTAVSQVSSGLANALPGCLTIIGISRSFHLFWQRERCSLVFPHHYVYLLR